MRTPKKSIKPTTHHHTHPSSNWKHIQSKLPKIPANVKAKQALKRQLRTNNNLLPNLSPSHHESQDPVSVSLCQILQQGVSGSKINEIGRFLAIDCEMVGVGPNGSESVLARVSIVNYYGAVLLDSYVSPKEKVTDYRTWVSGITPQHLANASSFSEVTSKVAELIKDKVLIGHAITNDLQALLLKHPRALIRDTSKYEPLRGLARTKFPSLKKLAALLLRLEIQTSSHSSVDDARATMAVYRTQKDAWEASLRPQHSSFAPLFRPPSRPKAVIATPTPPQPTSPPPVAPVASSSKPSPVVDDTKKQLNSKQTQDQLSPKVTVTNKAETKAKLTQTPGKEVSLTNHVAKGNTIKVSEVIKDISHPTQSPPEVIKSSTSEFKKPRTSNLRLSATLQHIRNEQETAAEKSASQTTSPSTKIPASPSSSSGQKAGLVKKTKSLKATSTPDLSQNTSNSNQASEGRKARHQTGHPYTRKPQPGNPKPVSKADVPKQRSAGGVKGVREYGTEMIGVVRKSNSTLKASRAQASSSFHSHPQSTNSSGWWDS